ncbi:MAG: hypothetical protein PHI45_01485, partial [Candidatus Pacebacteria bacterium]|nr:hypothetical protein [Candidatus Paceibacterota bacterium]
LFENEKEQKDGFIVGKGHELDTVLINMNPGEEKEAKPGLKIILNSVKKVEIPEINDEFVKTLGQFNTIEELKKNIEQGLKQEKETAIKQKQRAEVLEKIATKIKIDIPQSLVEREAQGLISNLQNRVKNELNISFEEYLDQTKKTLEQVQKEFEKIAYDRVRNFLIIRQIIKNQGIEVKKEEIEDRIKEILANYPEESKKQIDLDRIKLYIEDEIKNEKAFALLNL